MKQLGNLCRAACRYVGVGAALTSTVVNLLAPSALAAENKKPTTATPIQHVIVIIGENRTFDHVYATYVPKHGQRVLNLLSRGIVKADGTPGPNASLAFQNSAVDSDVFRLAPGGKSIYPNIPAPETGFTSTSPSDTSPAPFQTLQVARLAEPDLLPRFDHMLLTGATGLPFGVPDTRIPNVNNLGSGVFQLTPGVTYDDYAASPVHRFYQMWQQLDCDKSHASRFNPSGCISDLFPWVEVSVGAGSNGAPPNDPINTFEGGTAMEFFNVQRGDAPYMKYLADHFTMSDNMHQSVMGGTGANHVLFGYADDIFYSDGHGNPLVPPVNQIENPNPQPGTNNWYDQDGYGGGTYSNCNDLSQPGVPAVVNYLQSLARPISPNCAPNAYYLLNNYNPGYNGNGTLNTGTFTIPPTSVRHIGDALSEKGVSYTYFGEGWNLYVSDPNGTNPYDAYCNICNPFQYATDIMTDPAQIEAHIQDTTSLYEDIATNNLPAVSIVKPSGYLDGHPSSSKLDLFEAFTYRIVNQVQSNPDLWANTAIFITFDEGGGYYDAGYVQPLDFFGDGTRIPLLIVSPFSTGGVINHSYADHVSIIKFIERNWTLSPLTSRSRDNYPNPTVANNNPYVPTNSPALDDLFDAFSFNK